MGAKELFTAVSTGAYDDTLIRLYGADELALNEARNRLAALIQAFSTDFPKLSPTIFTAPGRTEMGGNHTDHQHGAVLAASVDLDMLACAATNDSEEVLIRQEGYPDLTINVADLKKRDSEEGSFVSLVRGVLAGVEARGYKVSGFSAILDSKVPTGSGLSSSAAYEVLIGSIANTFFCAGALTPVEVAQIGQFAENVYFGKPSGLMDQVACSVGGVISVDLADPDQPHVQPVNFDLDGTQHTLCIIDSGADHSDLTDDYTQITQDMSQVAGHFGKTHLRDVDVAQFWNNLPNLRADVSDRSILRAIHFFEDNERVAQQAQALRDGRFDDFLELVSYSGLSSQTQLQNIYSLSRPEEQDLGVAIALAQNVLDGKGAVRVHGGGFAGTIQAYVPTEDVQQFKERVETVLGPDSCHVLRIRSVGAGPIILG